MISAFRQHNNSISSIAGLTTYLLIPITNVLYNIFTNCFPSNIGKYSDSRMIGNFISDMSVKAKQ